MVECSNSTSDAAQNSGVRIMQTRFRSEDHAVKSKTLTRTALAVLTGLVALGLSGCGSGTQTATLTQAPLGSPTSTTSSTSTRLAATVRYANAGIILQPPPANATPPTTAQQALATCSTGDTVCEPARTPSVQLALATLTNTGTAGSKGTLVPAATKRLVWAMTWTGFACAPSGGPPGRSITQYPNCTMITLIDAQTGKELYAVSGPHL
jgi:hypothetical protein